MVSRLNLLLISALEVFFYMNALYEFTFDIWHFVLLNFDKLFLQAHDTTLRIVLFRIRTERNGGAWCPKQPISRDTYEWLEIDLQELKVVTQVETQGRFGYGQVRCLSDDVLLMRFCWCRMQQSGKNAQCEQQLQKYTGTRFQSKVWSQLEIGIGVSRPKHWLL